MRRTNGNTSVYNVLRPTNTSDGRGGKLRTPTAVYERKERGRIMPIQTGEHIRDEKNNERTFKADLIGTFRFGADIKLDDVLERGSFQARVVFVKDAGGRGQLMQVNLQEIQGAPQTR